MGYQDSLANIMPIEWLDPYGRMPFAGNMETSVDITIVETDDGIKASSVKNPPKSGPSRIMQAIQQALGVDPYVCGALCSSPQAADQGKQKSQKNDVRDEAKDSNDKKEDKSVVSCDTMESAGSEDSSQGSQPWSKEKSNGPSRAADRR
jgi:hypothetical protein